MTKDATYDKLVKNLVEETSTSFVAISTGADRLTHVAAEVEYGLCDEYIKILEKLITLIYDAKYKGVNNDILPHPVQDEQ